MVAPAFVSSFFTNRAPPFSLAKKNICGQTNKHFAQSIPADRVQLPIRVPTKRNPNCFVNRNRFGFVFTINCTN